MQVVLVRFFFISILYNRQWCTFEYGCQRKGLQHSCCTPLDFVLLIFRSFMNAYKRVLKLNIYSPLSYLNRFFYLWNHFFLFFQISETYITEYTVSEIIEYIESTMLVQSRLWYASQIARNKNAPQRWPRFKRYEILKGHKSI